MDVVGAMTRLVVVTALRAEYVALSGRVPGAVLARCGMGPERVQDWLPQLDAAAPDAIVVAGVAGGLDPTLRPGDVVVATEVRDEHGRTVQRAAAPLVAELRRMGFAYAPGRWSAATTSSAAPKARAKLAATGAVAVDMESAAIVRAAGAIPTAVVRVIVDTAFSPVARLATVPAGARALLTLAQDWPGIAALGRSVGPRRVLLAAPRSFCAGVERAIDIVELALQRYPRPVYVRRQIVHNAHVVADLQRQGAVFVDELDQVPDGTTVVFSAHGVSPAVRLKPHAAGSTSSTPPARWWQRCTARRAGSSAGATPCCSSATRATTRSRARSARRLARSCSWRTRPTPSAWSSPIPAASPSSPRRRWPRRCQPHGRGVAPPISEASSRRQPTTFATRRRIGRRRCGRSRPSPTW